MKFIIVQNGCHGFTRYTVDTVSGTINGSHTWLCLGLSHIKRNQFVPLVKVTPEWLQTMKNLGGFFWKNGKCQWTIRDLDHGTTREWGNPKLHDIYFED